MSSRVLFSSCLVCLLAATCVHLVGCEEGSAAKRSMPNLEELRQRQDTIANEMSRLDNSNQQLSSAVAELRREVEELRKGPRSTHVQGLRSEKGSMPTDRTDSSDQTVLESDGLRYEILGWKQVLFGDGDTGYIRIELLVTNTETTRLRRFMTHSSWYNENTGDVGSYATGFMLADNFGNRFRLQTIRPDLSRGPDLRPNQPVKLIFHFEGIPLGSTEYFELTRSPSGLKSSEKLIARIPITKQSPN